MLIIGTIIAFVLMISCVVFNIPLAFGLVAAYLVFMGIARREFSWRQVLQNSWQGAKTSLIVIRVLVMIGALIGIWMSSGTIATIVYYSFAIANPHIFVLLVFVICALVSFVIGTSFGTVSVIGLPLMLVAKSGDINQAIVAGAIISGIYFGDRISPLSSSASLVAAITFSNLFKNIKSMFRTSWLAILLTLIGYGVLSVFNPLNHINQHVLTELKASNQISYLFFIPVLIIVIFSMLKKSINFSITVSGIVALILGLWQQGQSWRTLVLSIVTGFQPHGSNPLIHGGGIISMINPMSVVFISCAIAGLLNPLSEFKAVKDNLHSERGTANTFGTAILVSLVTSAIGCNQSVSIVMTNTLIGENFEPADRAMVIENSSVVTAPLIPWNIAVFVPNTIIGASFVGYLPYALFLYLVPLLYWCQLKWR